MALLPFSSRLPADTAADVLAAQAADRLNGADTELLRGAFSKARALFIRPAVEDPRMIGGTYKEFIDTVIRTMADRPEPAAGVAIGQVDDQGVLWLIAAAADGSSRALSAPIDRIPLRFKPSMVNPDADAALGELRFALMAAHNPF